MSIFFGISRFETVGNGRGTQEAGLDLITMTTRWNPGYGLKLLKVVIDHKGLIMLRA